jgi:hypothetical protein
MENGHLKKKKKKMCGEKNIEINKKLYFFPLYVF